MPLPFLVSEVLVAERIPEKVVVFKTLKVFTPPFIFRFPEKERFPVCTVALPNVIVMLPLAPVANELEIVRFVSLVLMIAADPPKLIELVPIALSFPIWMVPTLRLVVPE